MLNWKKVARFALLASVLVLSACNTAQPQVIPTAAPTADLGLVRTQAAETVVAQITQDALMNPSATPTAAPTETATPLPPTATATAPATLAPAATATKAPGSSGGSGSGTGTGGGSYVYPTNTGTPYTDQAKLTSETVAYGQAMQPGQDFDASWTFKNTGLRKWNKDFYIKYLSGELKPKSNIYMLPASGVDKNDTVTMVADFIAPSQPGTYVSNWGLVNDDGVAFFHFYVVITVK